MPYVNKELAKEYRKRTQVSYMRKWREKNREKHRIYMREWGKKRRQNKEIAKKDYEKSKQLQSYKRNAAKTNNKLKLKCAQMDDSYIIYSMTKRGTISKDIVNKDLIEIHKKMLIIKRELKKIQL